MPGYLNPCYGFVLQNTYYDATILRLCILWRSTTAHLIALAHCSRCKHPRKWDLALLDQNIGYIAGPLLAEFQGTNLSGLLLTSWRRK